MSIKMQMTAQGANITAQVNAMHKGAPKAMTTAINRGLDTGRAKLAKGVSSRYNIKSSDVKKTAKLKKAKANRLVGEMEVKGRRIKLIQFKAKAGRSGVSVKIKKSGGKALLAHAFISTVKTRQVFERKRKGSGRVGRGPLRTIVGPSIPMLSSAAKIRKEVGEAMTDTLRKTYTHELERNRTKAR